MPCNTQTRLTLRPATNVSIHVAKTGLIEAVRTVDPDIQVQWSRTLEAQMTEPVLLFRGFGAAFLVFGALALMLSAASVHALASHAVARRLRELGLRQALGAPRGAIVGTVLARTLRQLAMGALLGFILALLLLRVGTLLPWQMGRGAPGAVALVVLTLLLAVAAAVAGPLRSAVTIQPAQALGRE